MRATRIRPDRERPDVAGNKVFTYQTLKTINQSSVNYKRNRNVHFENLPIKDDGTVYPTSFAIIHNDVEVRARIVLNIGTDTCWLDMSFAEWNALPTVEAYMAKRDELLESADDA